jgi:hypothetical protein
MKNLFLKVDGVTSLEMALQWSINAALQRNKVYEQEDQYETRNEFRKEWAKLLTEHAEAYREPEQPISDGDHCDAIAQIADVLSIKFGTILVQGRLRFGTSQKAFNSYLKYLWALGKIPTPPHCPVDSVVLRKVGLSDSWTKSDSREQYIYWINEIRKRLTLAEWENEVWLRWKIDDTGF